MMGSGMCRKVSAAVVVAAMVVQTPIAWAQLADIDPALHAAVEALVTSDPEVASNPELAELCRTVAEATILDPRERAAVTREVVAMHQEGVDVGTVIPQEVREAAREQFAKVQGDMREKLEALQASNPEMAREMELMMREGERQMLAFESGDRYTPSSEMVAHAETMMREWETDALAQGAPPEMVERAREEFARWSSGEMTEMMEMMGPGHEMMGMGPGEMPSLEQMEAMVAGGQMSPEQLQMAKEYMQGGFEQMGPAGFESYHAGMESYQAGMESYQAGMEAYQAGTELGQQMEQQYKEYMQVENLNYDTQQQQNAERTEFVPHPGHLVDQDNNPGTPDQAHIHEVHVHADGARHDHTTPGSGL